MTRRNDWMKNVQVCNAVQATNNQKLNVPCKGTVNICVSNDKNTETIVAEDVLYVPKLAANLLSVSKITEKGYNVLFMMDECAIMDGRNIVVAKGQRCDGVYQLVSSKKKAMVATTENYNLWHRRLGHLNVKA